jgi:hypothetical protein
VQTQEACNKDDNYHYADDVENIHCVLRSRYARVQYESARLNRNVRAGRYVPSFTEIRPPRARADIDKPLRPDLHLRARRQRKVVNFIQTHISYRVLLLKDLELPPTKAEAALGIAMRLLFNSGTSPRAGCWLPDRSSRRVHRCPKETQHLPAQ